LAFTYRGRKSISGVVIILSVYLKWQDYHKHSLLSVCKNVLDEGPAGADEDDGKEEECAFQQMSDVVEYGPEMSLVLVQV
jgi:hypothetical protein